MSEIAVAYEPTASVADMRTLELTMEQAQAIARQLTDYVERAGLVVTINRNRYVRIEGWQLLCHLVNLPFPSIVEVKELPYEQGCAYRACAEVVYRGVRYRAYAICESAEPNWRGKPRYALMSMAQTRAVGKLLRLLLGFLMPLAGYAATPAEEVIDLESTDSESTDSPEELGGGPQRGHASRPTVPPRHPSRPERQSAQPPRKQQNSDNLQQAIRLSQQLLGADATRAILRHLYGKGVIRKLQDNELTDYLGRLRQFEEEGDMVAAFGLEVELL